MSDSKTNGRVWVGSPDLEPLLRPIDELVHDPKQARVHGDRQLKVIRRSLEASGQNTPIVVGPSGFITKGNGTVQAAKLDPAWTHLAVVSMAKKVKKGTDERRYVLADNRSAELSEWSFETLADQLADFELPDIDDIGWTEEESNAIRLLTPWKGKPEGDDPQKKAAEHTVFRLQLLEEGAKDEVTQALEAVVDRFGGRVKIL